MRKVLLLAALCALAVFTIASAASAQEDLDCGQLSEAEEQAVFASAPGDPHGLDADDDGIPCEDDTTDDGSFALPEETTMMEPTTVEPTTVEPTTVSPAADQYSATPEPLPETGGTSLALAIAPLALLVGGSLLAFRIVRRS